MVVLVTDGVCLRVAVGVDWWILSHGEIGPVELRAWATRGDHEP